jgi:hypothetical protein
LQTCAEHLRPLDGHEDHHEIPCFPSYALVTQNTSFSGRFGYQSHSGHMIIFHEHESLAIISHNLPIIPPKLLLVKSPFLIITSNPHYSSPERPDQSKAVFSQVAPHVFVRDAPAAVVIKAAAPRTNRQVSMWLSILHCGLCTK